MSDTPTAPPTAPRRRVYPVGQLLTGINGLLQDRVGRVFVQGEVSNLHRAGSGHIYFTLKDDRGQIRAALFRSSAQRVRFELEEGTEVIVGADVGVYEARGDLQLIVKSAEPVGKGALQLAFEQLRRRLESEGLFDEAHKEWPPELPKRVGVVTSPTSAAVRDVIHVTGRRYPGVPLLISPTRVQGEGAEFEIVAALEALLDHGECDVILIVRGGGSLEDLWAFNSEALARAVFDCPVPVISGVGHETDLTICDLVADVRAPTPSAAAELALPDRAALAGGVRDRTRRLVAAMMDRLTHASARHEKERGALRMLAPTARLAARRIRFEAAARSLSRLGPRLTVDARGRLAAQAARLDSLSPLAVLSRGYALVRRKRDGAVVRRESEVAVGDALEVRLAEVDLEATVDIVRPRESS
ncbi:MAG: exodeoxyribonuclease VII large subunit [Myxococcota bacterium]|jgi:exodeoxyribonuclease VII large subunit|nr:exodeoxyribonuclease VII large subunit [Myxococcota bacterium]